MPNSSRPTPVKVKKRLAKCFHVAEFLQEEMDARGWSIEELARRMGGDKEQVKGWQLTVELTLYSRDPDVHLGYQTAKALARAFVTSAEFWDNIDSAWRGWIRRQPKAKRAYCQQPDRDVPGIKCGYPLPCPHHTVTLDVAAQTVEIPAKACVGAKGLRRLRAINDAAQKRAPHA